MKSNSEPTDATPTISLETASQLFDALTLPGYLKTMEERINLLNQLPNQLKEYTPIPQEKEIKYDPNDFSEIKSSFLAEKKKLIELNTQYTNLQSTASYTTKSSEDTLATKFTNSLINAKTDITIAAKKKMLSSQITALSNNLDNEDKRNRFAQLSQLNKQYKDAYKKLDEYIKNQIHNLDIAKSDITMIRENLNNLLQHIISINLVTPQIIKLKNKIVLALDTKQPKIIPTIYPNDKWVKDTKITTPNENRKKKKPKLATISDETNPPRQVTPNKSKKIYYEILSEKDREELLNKLKLSETTESDILKGRQILDLQKEAALKAKEENDRIEEEKTKMQQQILERKNQTTLQLTQALRNEEKFALLSAQREAREAAADKKKEINKSIIDHDYKVTTFEKKINTKIEKANRVMKYLFSRDDLFNEPKISNSATHHDDSLLTRLYRFFTSKFYPTTINHNASIPPGIELMKKTFNTNEEKSDASNEERLKSKLTEMKRIAGESLENYTGSDLTKEFYKIFQNLENIDQTCHSLVKLDKLTKALENFYTLKHYEKQGANISDFKNNPHP